ADPAGAAGRREHAGLRQEPHARGGERAGGVSRGAASIEPATGADTGRGATGDGPGRLTAPHVEAEPVLIALLAAGALYARGWWVLSQRMPARFGARHLAAFL